MTWAYRFEEEALRDIRRLDFEAQKRIIRYLDTRVAGRDDPRRFVKPLRGDKFGFWRWRVVTIGSSARSTATRLL